MFLFAGKLSIHHVTSRSPCSFSHYCSVCPIPSLSAALNTLRRSHSTPGMRRLTNKQKLMTKHDKSTQNKQHDINSTLMKPSISSACQMPQAVNHSCRSCCLSRWVVVGLNNLSSQLVTPRPASTVPAAVPGTCLELATGGRLGRWRQGSGSGEFSLRGAITLCKRQPRRGANTSQACQGRLARTKVGCNLGSSVARGQWLEVRFTRVKLVRLVAMSHHVDRLHVTHRMRISAQPLRRIN
jgi:hypothetical protein